MRELAILAVLAALPAAALAHAAPPSIEAPPDITVEAEWYFTRVGLGDAAVGVEPGTPYNVTNDAPSLFRVGETRVSWLVTDGAGGRAADFQTVAVLDTSPPECPTLEAMEYGAKPGRKAQAWFDIPVIPDAADLDVDVSSSHKPGARLPVGNHTVVFVASDDSGNVAECPMEVRVLPIAITGLVLEPSRDSIRAAWDAYENRTSYRVALEGAGGEAAREIRVSGTSHVFSDLLPGTAYTVRVSVQGERAITAEASASTLPAPPAITDDFSSMPYLWLSTVAYHTYDRSAKFSHAHDSSVGNPAPSAKLGLHGPALSINIDKWFELDWDDELYLGIDYKSGSNATIHGQIVAKTDEGRFNYVKAFMAEPGSGWISTLEEISRAVGGGDRLLVQLYLFSVEGTDVEHVVHYDNLYISTAPPPTRYSGGSAPDPGQEEFNRVLSQILAGEADPYEYLEGEKTLGKYDGLLRSVLVSLGVVDP